MTGARPAEHRAIICASVHKPPLRPSSYDAEPAFRPFWVTTPRVRTRERLAGGTRGRGSPSAIAITARPRVPLLTGLGVRGFTPFGPIVFRIVFRSLEIVTSADDGHR